MNANRAGGRFNRPGEIAQYFCLHPLGPWAEYLRQEHPPPDQLSHFRHRLWAVQLDLSSVVVIDWDDAPTFDLTPDDLVGDDHGPCQALADRMRDAGVRTIVVPSAALPGTRNAVVFDWLVPAPYTADPVEDVDVPCAVAADDATVVAAVLPFIRHRGMPHAELDAWQRGERYWFTEPDVGI